MKKLIFVLALFLCVGCGTQAAPAATQAGSTPTLIAAADLPGFEIAPLQTGASKRYPEIEQQNPDQRYKTFSQAATQLTGAVSQFTFKTTDQAGSAYDTLKAHYPDSTIPTSAVGDLSFLEQKADQGQQLYLLAFKQCKALILIDVRWKGTVATDVFMRLASTLGDNLRAANCG